MTEDTTPRRAGIYARVSIDKAGGRSVSEQETEGERACEHHGWTVAERYRDNDRSASRFATKDRPDWTRLLADLDDGKLDVLVIWEPSRGSRDLEDWAALLRRCRTTRTLIHVVNHDHTYDVTKARDWRTLAEDGVDSAYESEKTSMRIRRTKASAAEAGRADGRYPYGYERIYDHVTRKFVEQRPHPEQAPTVREIFTRIERGDPISTIARDLNMPRNKVRRIASNPTYISKRQYGGRLLNGTWPPLVDEGTFYAVQRVLSDPIRKTTRPGRVKHLLSYLARCGVCGEPLSVRAVSGKPMYVCNDGTHVGIRVDWADRYITTLTLGRLSAPDVYPALAASDDSAVMAARGEVEVLRARLEGFYDSAAAGELSPAALARVEARLLPEISDAERRATMAATPPQLRALLDPEVDMWQRWDEMSPAARKDVLRVLFSVIRVHPAQGRRSTFEGIDERRIEAVWLSQGMP